MLDEIEAVRFDRMMSNGRTRPMLLACETAVGPEVEVIAKFARHCTVPGMVREAMSAMLARDLGLPIPEPFLVRVSPEFVSSLSSPDARTTLQDSGGVGFGSKRLPDGYGAWVSPGGRLGDLLEADALNVIAFDCWITNGDRRISNANLLTNGRRLAIFDHELALMTNLNLFWREPWTDSALVDNSPPRDHVLFAHLRNRSEYDLDALGDLMSAITDERIQQYRQALPAAWASFDDSVDRASILVRDLRDNVAAAILETTKALA